MAENARAALKRLEAHLKETESDTKLKFSKPSTAKGIAALEKHIGAKLPPSYVAFVTKFGGYKLSDEASSLPRAEDVLGLGPHNDLSAAQQAKMDRCLVFQQQSEDSEDYYVFDLDDRGKGGELAVRAFFNDDGLQDRRGRGKSFDEHISALVDELIDDYYS